MPKYDYDDAQKAGRKEIQNRKALGLPTALPALDDVLEGKEIRGEIPLGLIDVPSDQIVGTKTAVRASSFAPNFMPILEETSEFAMKWISLCDSHLEEGIRNPVTCCEYLNKYYVLEGNKRVSVLKYFDAPTIPAYVNRIIPAWKDEPEIRIYYEFLDFYNQTNINYLEFSAEGSYRQISRLTGHRKRERWTPEERIDFRTCYDFFSEAFEDLGGEAFSCTTGDAFLIYLKVYGYETVRQDSVTDFKVNLKKIWAEIEINQPDMETEEKLAMKLDPTPDAKKNPITQILPGSSTDKTVTKIAFIYYRNKEISGMTYSHELGRLYVEDVFRGRVHTTCYDNVTGETVGAVLEQAIEDGNTIIFTTSPLFLSASIKAAADHPEVKILNCSLNPVHKYIRTYDARIFEAKLLNGVLAGILTDTDKIGYISNYPTTTVPAAIDAFALGVKMVNPKAKILLEWTSAKENIGVNLNEKLFSEGARYISHLDMIVPREEGRQFGLYHFDGEHTVNLAFPVLDWGKYYERIIQNVLHGTWKTESRIEGDKAVSYFWGMSSGVVDVMWADVIPSEARNLLETLKRAIMRYDFNAFKGTIHTQNGVIEAGPQGLTTPEIIAIDWLADNVIGDILAVPDIAPESQPLVIQEGIRKDEEETE
ncbi:MAG: BMP family ABC transporter substrate-binding protein [Lachnospiraceae bacterium]|nr:BMP family ABC transporter substrate-binding protein [Lachnospiraceae bacterium]